MIVRCACGKEDCAKEIKFLGERLLVIEDRSPDGKEIGLYLDANGMVALIKELKEHLLALTEMERK